MDLPAVAALGRRHALGDAAAGQRGDQAGAGHGRLAAARGADDGEEGVLGDVGNELGGEFLTTKEALGVLHIEVLQTLVGRLTCFRRLEMPVGGLGFERLDLTIVGIGGQSPVDEFPVRPVRSAQATRLKTTSRVVLATRNLRKRFIELKLDQARQFFLGEGIEQGSLELLGLRAGE